MAGVYLALEDCRTGNRTPSPWILHNVPTFRPVPAWLFPALRHRLELQIVLAVQKTGATHT